MQFDWWSLALQAVNFLVLVWLLQRFLFRPVQRLVEARKAKSDDLLRSAERKLAEAETERARYEELIAAFEAAKEDSLRDFQKKLDADRESALAKAQESADAMIASAREEIAEDQRKSIAESRTDLVSLAKDVASRILTDRLKAANLEADVGAALDKLTALPDPERRRILKTMEASTAKIIVETSVTLIEAEQDAISKQLQKELGKNVDIVFTTTPDILGGVRINLPQAQLDASWASYLDAAIERLLERDHGQ